MSGELFDIARFRVSIEKGDEGGGYLFVRSQVLEVWNTEKKTDKGGISDMDKVYKK